MIYTCTRASNFITSYTSVCTIGVVIPLNRTVEFCDALLKLFTPDMVRVTSHLYIPLSSVALVSVALIANDDVLLLLVTCQLITNIRI